MSHFSALWHWFSHVVLRRPDSQGGVSASASTGIPRCEVIPEDVIPGTVLLDASSWQPADVLLFGLEGADGKGSVIIEALQRRVFPIEAARWTHAALYVGGGRLIEAVASSPSEVVLTSIARYSVSRDAMRLHCPELSFEERLAVIREAFELLHQPYDLRRAAWLGFTMLFSELGTLLPFDPRSQNEPPAGLVCSDLVVAAYIVGAGRSPVQDRPDAPTPAALATSALFIREPVSACEVQSRG